MKSGEKCELPVGTYRRLWLLYLLGQFRDACYGKVRLQKVAYFGELGQDRKPFTFRKAPYGPYSEELETTLEQLLSMGLVRAEPIGEGGNKYHIQQKAEGTRLYALWLSKIDPTAGSVIGQAVEEYGYMEQARLLDAGHAVPGFAAAEPFEEILSATVAESIPTGIDADECDELMLSLSPGFGELQRVLAETDWEADLDRVTRIGRL